MAYDTQTPETVIVAPFDGNAFDSANPSHVKAIKAFASAIFTPSNPIPKTGSERESYGKSDTAQNAFKAFVTAIGGDLVTLSRCLRSASVSVASESTGNPFATFDGHLNALRVAVGAYNIALDGFNSLSDTMPAIVKQAMQQGVDSARIAVREALVTVQTRLIKGVKVDGKAGLSLMDQTRLDDATSVIDSLVKDGIQPMSDREVKGALEATRKSMEGEELTAFNKNAQAIIANCTATRDKAKEAMTPEQVANAHPEAAAI